MVYTPCTLHPQKKTYPCRSRTEHHAQAGRRRFLPIHLTCFTPNSRKASTPAQTVVIDIVSDVRPRRKKTELVNNYMIRLFIYLSRGELSRLFSASGPSSLRAEYSSRKPSHIYPIRRWSVTSFFPGLNCVQVRIQRNLISDPCVTSLLLPAPSILSPTNLFFHSIPFTSGISKKPEVYPGVGITYGPSPAANMRV